MRKESNHLIDFTNLHNVQRVNNDGRYEGGTSSRNSSLCKIDFTILLSERRRMRRRRRRRRIWREMEEGSSSTALQTGNAGNADGERDTERWILSVVASIFLSSIFVQQDYLIRSRPSLLIVIISSDSISLTMFWSEHSSPWMQKTLHLHLLHHRHRHRHRLRLLLHLNLLIHRRRRHHLLPLLLLQLLLQQNRRHHHHHLLLHLLLHHLRLHLHHFMSTSTPTMTAALPLKKPMRSRTNWNQIVAEEETKELDPLEKSGNLRKGTCLVVPESIEPLSSCVLTWQKKKGSSGLNVMMRSVIIPYYKRLCNFHLFKELCSHNFPFYRVFLSQCVRMFSAHAWMSVYTW